MSVVQTRYEHIVVDEHGVPMIAGTTMKVVELVAEKVAYGWSAEELRVQHPYLSMGQIHSALAFYWDHAEELDRALEDDLQEFDQLHLATVPGHWRTQLLSRRPA